MAERGLDSAKTTVKQLLLEAAGNEATVHKALELAERLTQMRGNRA